MENGSEPSKVAVTLVMSRETFELVMALVLLYLMMVGIVIDFLTNFAYGGEVFMAVISLWIVALMVVRRRVRND